MNVGTQSSRCYWTSRRFKWLLLGVVEWDGGEEVRKWEMPLKELPTLILEGWEHLAFVKQGKLHR